MALRPLLAALLLTLAASTSGESARPEPDARDTEVRRIVERLARGEHEEVIRAVDDFLGRHPLGDDTFGILLLKAESQRRLGRVADAIDAYQRVVPFVERLHNVGQRRFVVVYFRLATL